jgi:hypothetical protein
VKALPLLVCSLVLLVPASAHAYVIGGSAWPGTTIHYHSAARGYAGPVARAARVWNKAGVGVRFVRSSRARADVVVRYGGPRCGGAAPVGYARAYDGSWVRLGAGCNRDLIMLTAVHELGHVLGLDHESGRCARMNPGFDASGSPDACPNRTLSYWLAHPLLGDDIRGARALYRGADPSEPDPVSDDGEDRGGGAPWWW